MKLLHRLRVGREFQICADGVHALHRCLGQTAHVQRVAGGQSPRQKCFVLAGTRSAHRRLDISGGHRQLTVELQALVPHGLARLVDGV